LPLPIVAAGMVVVDLVLMPLCAPVVQLGSSWLIGEAVAVAVVLVPAQCLARWTVNDTHLAWRAALQVIAFSGLILFVIPSAVLQQTGGDWTPVLDRSARWNSILIQIVALPAVIGLSAVQEFVTRGRGTPVPFDPPRQLVTTGPYAFVANPMQLATALVLLSWGLVVGNLWMIAAVAVTIAYSAGVATWDETRDLGGRFGEPWMEYRRAVQQWLPRWKPFIAQAGDGGSPRSPARLYVAHSCGTCRGVGAWLLAQGVIGLAIVPAERHPTRTLLRLTYEAPDGAVDEGVTAFARALEHINFGWAWVGMLMRLPLMKQLLQVIIDASGGYARPAQQPR
jgi:protein-S-isoprenylcysteine O-methyltransferase Ste14